MVNAWDEDGAIKVDICASNASQFAPKLDGSMATAAEIVTLLTDEARRLAVVEQGRAELARLTWAESARHLEAALEQARSTSGRRSKG